MPGLPVCHQLPELAQTHVCWVSDGSSCLILACANSRLRVHSDLFHVHLHSSSIRSYWRHFLVVDAQSTRAKPNQQAHLMLLLPSYSLAVHWPKQVTWLSPTPVGPYSLPTGEMRWSRVNIGWVLAQAIPSTIGRKSRNSCKTGVHFHRCRHANGSVLLFLILVVHCNPLPYILEKPWDLSFLT